MVHYAVNVIWIVAHITKQSFVRTINTIANFASTSVRKIIVINL